jgi:3-hydroxyacyl-CoA dehydrogenase
MEIKRAAVIGAGVMGSGIAAHIANAGVPVVLLDIVPKDAKDRSMVAKGAIEKMMKADPAPFMSKDAAKLITPGNLEDDLGLLAEVDWIIEVVIERLDVKRDLYSKLDKVRKAGSVVSSNTSTIPLQQLVEGQSEAFKKDFCITHFFNPPRYMRLLELITGPATRADAAAAVRDFCDIKLGKGVVVCKDRPGFIANRIGTFWIQCAFNEAMDRGLSVEEADLVMGKPLGFPKTGVFGLMDLVGLDLMPHIAKSLMSSLPKDDGFCTIYRSPPVFEKMIADGYTGRKGKGGFYRLNTSSGEKVKEAINLATGEYKKAGKPSLESAEVGKQGIKAVMLHPDKGGQYARAVLLQVLSYAASLVPEIADDVEAVDRAMKLGYNWKYGPFELIDAIGVDVFAAELAKDNKPVPALVKLGKPFYKIDGGKLYQLTTKGEYAAITRPAGVLLLSDIKRASAPVTKNGSASLWDIGDGVLCLEFTSKMNAIDDQIFAMYRKAIALIGDGKGAHKALVVHNEAENFSVGANLGIAMFALNVGLYPQIEQMVAEGQDVYKALKFAPFPTVAAPAGMALGGGCEILLHVSHVQAHAETYCGLVEVGVGLIPGWGGCKEMLIRYAKDTKKGGGPFPPVARAFETIGTAKVAKSAFEAKEIGYFRASDGITMNRDRLLFDAKQKALELAKNYKAPEPQVIRLPGTSGKAALNMAVEGFRQTGKATPYDVVVSDKLADVLTGYSKDLTDDVTEDELLKFERTAFVQLVKHEGTLERIEHMLVNGKPLRN